jgi:hypothetical protein
MLHAESAMQLKSHTSVAEFFHEVLTDAIRNQRVEASIEVESYLVHLLSAFAHTPPDDQPLALKVASAAQAAPDERAQKLREVGDNALYVSGFFSDSLARKLVDVDYYISLGGAAYGELANYFRGYCKHEAFGDVYDELGQKFLRFVDVLAEISETTSMTSNLGALQLYERWLRTGSSWMERRLRDIGMLPKKQEQH